MQCLKAFLGKIFGTPGRIVLKDERISMSETRSEESSRVPI